LARFVVLVVVTFAAIVFVLKSAKFHFANGFFLTIDLLKNNRTLTGCSFGIKPDNRNLLPLPNLSIFHKRLLRVPSAPDLNFALHPKTENFCNLKELSCFSSQLQKATLTNPLKKEAT